MSKYIYILCVSYMCGYPTFIQHVFGPGVSPWFFAEVRGPQRCGCCHCYLDHVVDVGLTRCLYISLFWIIPIDQYLFFKRGRNTTNQKMSIWLYFFYICDLSYVQYTIIIKVCIHIYIYMHRWNYLYMVIQGN